MRWLVLTHSLLSLVTASQLIMEGPSSVREVEGAPVTLICRVQEQTRLHIVWMKDTEELDTRNALHRVMTLPDGSLFILSSEAGDSGRYWCEARDGRGRVLERSTEAEVEIITETEYYDQEEAIEDPNQHHHTDGDNNRIVMEIEATAIEKEPSDHNDDSLVRQDIPLVFWIICLSVVSLMTLLVIFGAGFIIFKIRNMRSGVTDLEANGGVTNIYERPCIKRRSWIETPWNFYPSSTQLKTFPHQNLLNTSESTTASNNSGSSDYDYASSDYFLLSKSENLSKNKYILKSNHYASSNIDK